MGQINALSYFRINSKRGICKILFKFNQINGVRFVDKTQLGKKNMYRFEVWVSKNIPDDKLSSLKQFLKTDFESEVTITDNKVK